MPQPTIQSLHIDVPLTNIAVAYLQAREAFVSSSVFPTVPVNKKSNKYFTFPREYFFTSMAQKRAAGADAARSGYTVSTDSYNTERDALEHLIPDPDRDNADAPLDLDRDGTEFLAQQMLLAQEVDFASKYFATGIWDNNPTISPTWDDVTSNPIDDIKTQKRTILQNTGFMPNKLVLGVKCFDNLVEHPDVKDVIKYGQTPGAPAVANEEALAKVLGLDQVIVARATRNTVQEGIAASYSFINATRSALLVYSAPNPGLRVPSAGYKFVWGGAGNNAGVQIKSYRDEPHESTVLSAGIWYQHKAVSTALGSFMTNAVAA